MKVYLDIIFITNYIFDFIILLGTSLLLKRRIKIIKIILGSFVGSITNISLFLRLSTLELFILKIVVSVLMIIITFGFKNIRYFFKNIYYLYLISIILAGLLYFVNNQFIKNDGAIFYKTYKINIFFEILITLIGLFIYIRNIRNIKNNYNNYLEATIFFNNYEIKVNAFVDTGNKLVDPYFLRPIILVEEKLLKEDKYIYVPYKTCNNDGLLKCIKANRIYIENVGYRNNFFVGLISSINIDGVNCLLNEKLL